VTKGCTPIESHHGPTRVDPIAQDLVSMLYDHGILTGRVLERANLVSNVTIAIGHRSLILYSSFEWRCMKPESRPLVVLADLANFIRLPAFLKFIFPGVHVDVRQNMSCKCR
jgi:hypothetical protein